MPAMSSASQDSAGVGEGSRCMICDRVLVSSRGLTQHIRLMHPDEYNRCTLRAVSSTMISRNRWTDDERNALALLEIEALVSGLSGTLEICRYMVSKHGGRSLDSIRSERKGVAYQNALRNQQKLAQSETQNDQLSATVRPSASTSEQNPDEVESPSTDSGTSIAVSDSNVHCLFESDNIESSDVSGHNESISLRREIETGIEFLSTKTKFLAKDLILAANTVIENRRDLGPTMQWFNAIIGPKRPMRHGMGPKGPEVRARTRREGARSEFAKLQNLYMRAPKKAAKCILEGDRNVKGGPRAQAMFKFWENVFGVEGIAQGLEVNDEMVDGVSTDNVKAISGPITIEELLGSKPKRGKAPGPDGLSVTRWRVIPVEWKMLFYNIILYAEIIPEELIAARTIFIPKTDDPKCPGEYRPISITSVALRQLHTILARRLQNALVHDERQRAFQRSVDGSAENIFLLNAILKDARVKKKDLHLVSLDLNKAFDSVHHDGITSTLKKLGCPNRFIDHVRRVYGGATTTFQYKGQSYATRVKRGVLQGDPMSPILFNYIIDRALAKLNNSLGYLLGDKRISVIAFADDIVLVSGSGQGLQRNLNCMVDALKAFGLTVNKSKTSALTYRGVKAYKERRMALDTEAKLMIENFTVRQLGPTDEWKYLGTYFRGMANCEVVHDRIVSDVKKVSKAKLKPQQKLLILRQFVLPRYMHGLVLGKTSQMLLRKLDVNVRKFTRWWLRFPNDVPTAYLHSANRYGGLGVFSLELGIPCMRLRRLLAFIKQDSDTSRALAGSSFARDHLKACRSILSKIGVVEGTKQELAEYWRGQLEAKRDTEGLAVGNPVSHNWLRNGQGLTGGEYVRFNHLRAGCLPTAARLARGRVVETRCRTGCGANETNYHVIQQCSHSKGGCRIRHNTVVRYMGYRLVGEDRRVYVEPRFDTTEGLRIPDLIVVKGVTAWVLDVQVVKGDDMTLYHLNKAKKYQECPGLNRLIRERYNCTEIRHKPITVSYKGIIHDDTISALMNGLEVKKWVLERLSLMVLRGSYLNWSRLKARFWKGSRRNPNFGPPQ